MNILLLTTISGFLPKFLMRDVKLLQSKGFTVHYASNFNNPIYECSRGNLERQGICCHHIEIAKSPLAVKQNLVALRQLNQIVRENDIQAVHCHNPMGGVLGRLLSFKYKELYVIYTAHGFHFFKGAPVRNWLLYYPVERLLARRTHQLITINREDKEMANSFRLQKGGCVSRIPGVGLDVSRFRPEEVKRSELRRRYGAEADDYIFLSVGELNDNKNHKTIIDALARMQNPRAKLFICGAGANRVALEAQIKQLCLEGRVVLWGYQVEIENFYQAADCFLFPSIREGLGMAALEAMACGLPVIVGDNRGTREYTLDNGMICDPLDAGAFAAAMEKLMSRPKDAERLGRRSREIAADFSAERTDRVMAAVYERMLETLEKKDRTDKKEE